MADISSLVQESLSVSGILLGKTMGRSGELAERFEGESSRLADLEVRSRMTGRWLMQSIQMTFAIMPAAIYWFGGLAVHNEGPTASYAVVGTLVAFTTLQTRLFAPIGSLLSISVDVQSSLALFDRIFEYLDLRVDIEPGTRTLEHVRGDVHLDDVWFRYGEGPYALEGIDVVIPAGTTTAIVGETGAGKTTLGYLVSRLYDPSKGRITIDGVDIRELTFESLAANVGVVSQETYLFHATVRENLRFAKPDATDEEIEEAARAAQIHDLIASLPDGYETVVGERGYRFSGGEKQRMAIARAILRNPPILVLDEATSALDTQTERAVQEALAPTRRRAHDDRDRPPALDDPRRGPDRRPRRRARGRARHLRRAPRARRALRGACRSRFRLVRRRGGTRGSPTGPLLLGGHPRAGVSLPPGEARLRRRTVVAEEPGRALWRPSTSSKRTACRSSSRCRSGRSTPR